MDSNQTAIDPLIANTRLLSEEQFNCLTNQPYDPFWLDRVGFSETDQTTLLSGFNSKIKIDELIRGGALIAGDIFRTNVVVRTAPCSAETKSVTMEAEFCGASAYGQLNIRIRGPSEPSGYRTVNCTGLGKIVEAWMQEDPLVVEGSSNYKNFYISRNYTDLGSLWHVRQKWHLWREEKDAWATHRGQTSRHKRVTKAEKNDGYSYVKGKLTRTRNVGEWDGKFDGKWDGWWDGQNDGDGGHGGASAAAAATTAVKEEEEAEEEAKVAAAAPYYLMGESSTQIKREDDRF